MEKKGRGLREYIRARRYILLLLYVPIYLISFFAVEYLMPDTADYWASYCFIDDWIPFPNGQDLRLADLSSDNVFVRLVQVIYAAIVLAALICLSTCLIKQHSVLDVFAAVVL